MSVLDRKLEVIAFPGAPNLPLFAAQSRGFFADKGVGVQFETTPSSVYQFEQFGSGRFDIAFTAFDNVVAYREGQGAAKLADRPDFRALLGATQVELSIVVAPDVESAEDLRGRSLALDAVGTGFAFVLYDMLAKLGLPRDAYEVVPVGATPERWRSVKAGDHAGTITIEPFTSIAKAAGFRVLARSTDMFPAYQGGVIAARRDWAEAHGDDGQRFPERLSARSRLDARSGEPRSGDGDPRREDARDPARRDRRGDVEPVVAALGPDPRRRHAARWRGDRARRCARVTVRAARR